MFDQCLRCINLLGRIIVMGFTSGRIPTIPANLVLLKNCSILGVYLGGWISRDVEGAARMNRDLAVLAAQGQLRTHISRRFRFEEAVAAMKTLLGRDTVGKIVLDIGT